MPSVGNWDEILNFPFFILSNKKQDIRGDLANLLVLFLSAQKEDEIVFSYSGNAP